MFSTRVFQNGKSQAIRIPKEIRTEKKDYFINKIGEVYVVYPKEDPWAPDEVSSEHFLKISCLTALNLTLRMREKKSEYFHFVYIDRISFKREV